MPNKTPNLGYELPLGNETADIEVLNNNFIKIDEDIVDKLGEAKVYTDGKVKGLIGDAPGGLDTLKGLADVLNEKVDKDEFSSQMADITNNKLSLKANKTDLAATTNGSSGAKSIGVSTISGLTGNDVQTCMQNLFTFASNGKSSIATAITNKGVSASSSDTFSVLASKIGQINTGKKWQNGTTTSDSSGHITVALNFQPSIIIIESFVSGDGYYFTIYINKNDMIFYSSIIRYYTSISLGLRGINLYSFVTNEYVNSTGFNLANGPSNTSTKWIAIE